MAVTIQKNLLNRCDSKEVDSSSTYSSIAFQKMNCFRKNGQLCDVVIKAEGQEFLAHRVILAASSDYFDAMFSSGMTESAQLEVELRSFSPSVVEALLEYVYTGHVKVNMENVQELLPAASLVQLEGVKDACSNFLLNEIDASNVLGIRRFAELHNCVDLEKFALNFAAHNFESVVDFEEFSCLTHEELLDLITREDLHIDSEESVYIAAIRWVYHSSDVRTIYLASLLKNIRLPVLSVRFLTDVVDKDVLIRQSLECRDLVDDAKRFHLRPDLRHEMRERRYRQRDGGDEYLVVIGGFGSDQNPSDSVEIFNPRTFEWAELPDLPISCRYVASCSLGTRVYAIGGFDGHERLNTVCLLDIAQREEGWRWLTPMHYKRSLSAACTNKGVIYVCGGFDGQSRLRSLEVYHPKIDEWRILEEMTTAREGAGLVVVDDTLYCLGGYDGFHLLNSMEAFDLNHGSWTDCKPMYMRRSGAGCALLGDTIYVCGGYGGAEGRGPLHLDTVEAYNTRFCQWTLITNMNVPRCYVGACLLAGKIYVAAGYNGSRLLDTAESYDPIENVWWLHEESRMNHERCDTGMCVVRFLSYGTTSDPNSLASPPTHPAATQSNNNNNNNNSTNHVLVGDNNNNNDNINSPSLVTPNSSSIEVNHVLLEGLGNQINLPNETVVNDQSYAISHSGSSAIGMNYSGSTTTIITSITTTTLSTRSAVSTNTTNTTQTVTSSATLNPPYVTNNTEDNANLVLTMMSKSATRRLPVNTATVTATSSATKPQQSRMNSKPYNVHFPHYHLPHVFQTGRLTSSGSASVISRTSANVIPTNTVNSTASNGVMVGPSASTSTSTSGSIKDQRPLFKLSSQNQTLTHELIHSSLCPSQIDNLHTSASSSGSTLNHKPNDCNHTSPNTSINSVSTTTSASTVTTNPILTYANSDHHVARSGCSNLTHTILSQTNKKPNFVSNTEVADSVSSITPMQYNQNRATSNDDSVLVTRRMHSLPSKHCRSRKKKNVNPVRTKRFKSVVGNVPAYHEHRPLLSLVGQSRSQSQGNIAHNSGDPSLNFRQQSAGEHDLRLSLPQSNFTLLFKSSNLENSFSFRSVDTLNLLNSEKFEFVIPSVPSEFCSPSKSSSLVPNGDHQTRFIYSHQCEQSDCGVDQLGSTSVTSCYTTTSYCDCSNLIGDEGSSGTVVNESFISEELTTSFVKNLLNHSTNNNNSNNPSASKTNERVVANQSLSSTCRIDDDHLDSLLARSNHFQSNLTGLPKKDAVQCSTFTLNQQNLRGGNLLSKSMDLTGSMETAKYNFLSRDEYKISDQLTSHPFQSKASTSSGVCANPDISTNDNDATNCDAGIVDSNNTSGYCNNNNNINNSSSDADTQQPDCNALLIYRDECARSSMNLDSNSELRSDGEGQEDDVRSTASTIRNPAIGQTEEES